MLAHTLGEEAGVVGTMFMPNGKTLRGEMRGCGGWAAIRPAAVAWNVSKLSQRSGGVGYGRGGEGEKCGRFGAGDGGAAQAGGSAGWGVGRAFCAVSYEL